MRTDRLRRTKRILRILAGFVTALAVIYVSWSVWANMPPDVSIPPQKLPKPNGFDYYVQASDFIVNYQQLRDPADDVSPQMREQLVKSNVVALKSLRKALRYNCCMPRESQKLNSFDPLALARLLEHEMLFKMSESDWPGAMKSCSDRIQLGTNITRGKGLRYIDWSTLIQTTKTTHLWEIVAHLDLKSSVDAAEKMEKTTQSMPIYADILTEDKVRMELIMMKWFGTSTWRRDNIDQYNLLDGQDHTNAKIVALIASKRWLCRDMEETWDRAIDIARKPFCEAITYSPRSCYFFYAISTYYLQQNRIEWEKCRANNGLLTVALALHAYKLANGSYPTSLSPLISNYLTKLPEDPFAQKGTFKYSNNGASYRLYSLGPDCKDDGGMNNCNDIVAGAKEVLHGDYAF